MTAASLTAVLLTLAVLATTLAVTGLWRLPTALDRLHLIAFVNIAAGVPLLVAAALTDGPTPRSCKIAAILAINLLSGAAALHALGQALRRRGNPA